MTMNEKKKSESKQNSSKTTLGTEYLKRYNPDEKGYETRNIVEHYGSNRFGPMLEKVISTHRDFAKKYYIWIVNQELAHFEAKKINFVVRKSKPTPKWETILFSYDNTSSDLRLEWVLPTKEGGEAMLESPDAWDPQLIMYLHEHLPELQKQQAQILSLAACPPEGPGAFLFPPIDP